MELEIGHTYQSTGTGIQHTIESFSGNYVRTTYVYNKITGTGEYAKSQFYDGEWIDVTPEEDNGSSIPDYLFQREDDI